MHTLKHLIHLAIATASTISLSAQDVLPAEVAAARTRYEADLDASAKPIRQRYVSQLEAFKRSAMLRNDLKTAAAIDTEMKRVDPQTATVAGRDLRRQLRGTSWQWNARLILRFDGDTATAGIWTTDVKYSGDQAILTLRPPASLAGKKAIFNFDQQIQIGSGNDFDGTPHTITKIK